MKKLLVIILSLVVIGGVGFISYKNFSKNSKKINDQTLVYNGESGKWENVQNIPRINREELDKSPNEDGFNNMSLLRGYFDHYDEKSGDIVIKSLLPFTMGTQFEIVNLKVPVSKVVYCAPAITIVPKTGKEIPTQSLTFDCARVFL